MCRGAPGRGRPTRPAGRLAPTTTLASGQAGRTSPTRRRAVCQDRPIAITAWRVGDPVPCAGAGAPLSAASASNSTESSPASWEKRWRHDRNELAAARQTLLDAGAYTGESSHGATKSVYGADPDGNEFELMWMLPRQEWGVYERSAPIDRLDLAGEIERWSGVATAGQINYRSPTSQPQRICRPEGLESDRSETALAGFVRT